jgi:sugar-phosphatase
MLPACDHEAEARQMEEDQAASATTGVIALPGAVDIVRLLSGRHRWGIVTSGGRRIATARLRAARLTIPDVLITSEHVARGKPCPDGYLAGARELGLPPTRCLCVEDTSVGVRAGRDAGLFTVAVTTTHVAADLSGADLIVTNLLEVSELLMRSDRC